MFITFLWNSIRFSTVYLFGSTGETLVEKGGHLNLGIPGIMCIGAFGGLVGEVMYLKTIPSGGELQAFPAIVLPILMCILFSALVGLLYSFFTITLRCNQNVTGLAITTFGAGIFNFYGQNVVKRGYNFSKASLFFTKTFPFAEKLGWFSKIFFSYGFLVYTAFFISIIAQIVLSKTRVGLNLRAVGENPSAADAAGIDVTKYKYVSSVTGAVISGFGGLFYIFDQMGGSIEYSIDACGWLAVALVIFSFWKPANGILGAIVFAALYFTPSYFSFGIPKDIFKMLPYVVTTIVLIIVSIRRKRENQPPAGLGVPYYREER